MKRGRGPARLFVLLLGCTWLAACSEANLASYAVKEAQSPSADNSRGGQYKIGKPYQIQGVWYYPAEDYSYSETGIASWYGPDFHGRYTANGEIFDQNDVTAAHRTLPMPCFVRVTNLDNGRSLVVRVNDRGPYSHSRIIDLSRHAAELLGMEGTGTARVKVEIMAEESRALAMRMKANQGEATAVAAAPREAVTAESLPPPGSREEAKPIARPQQPTQLAALPPPPSNRQLADQPVRQIAVKPTSMYVQAGAFSRIDYAERLSARLSPLGKATISQVNTRQGTFFRVRMGPIATQDEADNLLERVISNGNPDARLVVD